MAPYLSLMSHCRRALKNVRSFLQRQYDEVIEKRKSYVAAAEKLCSCRHVSRLGSVSVYHRAPCLCLHVCVCVSV